MLLGSHLAFLLNPSFRRQMSEEITYRIHSNVHARRGPPPGFNIAYHPERRAPASCHRTPARSVGLAVDNDGCVVLQSPIMAPRIFLIATTLAVAVLVDSWISEEAFDALPGSTAPAGSGGTPEVADQRAPLFRPDRDSQDVPLAGPLALIPSVPSVEPPRQGQDAIPPEPRPVSPSGWLGRRHWRSPT